MMIDEKGIKRCEMDLWDLIGEDDGVVWVCGIWNFQERRLKEGTLKTLQL
jgi:hypothetical protein